MKACCACKETLSLSAFYRDSKSRDGRGSTCKPCAKAKARRQYASDPERCKQRVWEWQRANRERAREYQRRLHARTPEYQRARSRRYYEENREKWRGYWTGRRALEGPSTPELRECVAEIIRQPCVYCGSTDRIEVDHIVPLARGGKHEPENLAPACLPCNRSKGSKLLSEWLVSR